MESTTLGLMEETSQWSLASDRKLLEALQKFSSNVTLKAKEIVDNLDNLTSDVAEADVRLHNTFNEFMMLADGQFIENRVYEDDDSDGESENSLEHGVENSKSDDVKQVLVSAFQEGIEAMKLFYDTVEDEEPTGIEENKIEDIYNVRPLPFIIGTQQFIDSNDAGLGEANGVTEENDDNVVLDHGSDSDDDDASESRTSLHRNSFRHSQEDAKDEFSGMHQVVRRSSEHEKVGASSDASFDDYSSDASNEKSSDDTGDDDGDDDNIASDDDVDDDNECNKKESQNRNVSIQSDVNDDSDEGSDDLFGDSKDDPYSLFGAPLTAPKKGKGSSDALSGLFGNDTKDEVQSRSDSFASVDSLFDQNSQKPLGSQFSKNKDALSNLFGTSNDDNIFDDVEKTIEPSTPDHQEESENALSISDNAARSNKKSGVQSIGSSDLYSGGDLFGGDDESEDSLFMDKPAEKNKFEETSKKSTSSLFGGDSTGSQHNTKPTTNTADTTKPDSFSNLFGNDDSDDNLFGSKSTTRANPEKKKTHSKTKDSTASSGLFDGDGSDDDLFSSKPTPIPEKKSSGSKTASTTTKKPTASSSLFGDDNSDDDLFASKPKAKTETAKKEPLSSKMSKTGKSLAATSGLFGDDDSDDDLFGKPKTKTEPKNKGPGTTKVSAASSGLFGDVSSDDDELFSNEAKSKPEVSKAESPASSTAAAKKVSSGLFGDDDSDDLFDGESKSISKNSKAVTKPPEAKKSAISSGLFDDDSGDELFGSKTSVDKKEAHHVAKSSLLSTGPLDGDNSEDNSFSSSRVKRGMLVPDSAAKSSSNEKPVPFSGPFGDVSDDADDFSEEPKSEVHREEKVSVNLTGGLLATSEIAGDDEEKRILEKGAENNAVADDDLVEQPVDSTADDMLDSRTISDKASPLTSSPSLSTKRMSGALAKRMSGLDSSKIFMPGMAPPSKLSQNRERTTSSEESGSGEIINATLDRAMVGNKKGGRSRKAPTRKKMALSADQSDFASSSLHGDGVVASKNMVPSNDNEAVNIAVESQGDPEFETEKAPEKEKPSSSDANKKEIIPSKMESKISGNRLFGDDDNDDGNDIFGNKKNVVSKTSANDRKSSSLFGDDESDDDLFGSKPLITKKPAAASTAKNKGELFGDDSDDDLFSSKKKSADMSIKAKSSSLFGDDDSDDDLFGSKSKPKSSGKKGLFDD